MKIFFFFQAEDGIRDKLVTGVQTCALPICRIPVRRYAEIGIRLPPSRTNHHEEFILLERMNPFDRQRSDARLLPLLDLETNKYIALFALVVVFDVRLDLGIEKTVRLVEVTHRLRVGVHQPPAEASRRSESAAEDLQPASQQVRVEVLIPGDFYPD